METKKYEVRRYVVNENDDANKIDSLIETGWEFVGSYIVRSAGIYKSAVILRRSLWTKIRF